MKKTVVIAVSIMLGGVANANLVVNGSFEQGTVGVYAGNDLAQTDAAIPGWRIFDTTGTTVAYELVSDAAEATDGNNYVKITSTVSTGGDSGMDITQNGLGAVAATVGANYLVSFDAKRVAGTNNNMLVTIRTFDGNTIVEAFYAENLSLTSEWETYSYEITPTLFEGDGDEPNFYIGFRPKGATMLDETIYIDNVSVVQIPDPTSLVNGSFEQGPLGVLSLPSYAVTGWRAFGSAGDATFEVVNDPVEATDGTNYIEIVSEVSGVSNDAGLDVRSAFSGECMLTTGDLYRVSFDAKWVSGTGNSLNFQVKTFEEGTSHPVFEDGLVALSFAVATNWTTYSYEFTPTLQPTNVANGITFYAGFRPKAGGTRVEEVIRVDNVRLLNLSTGTYIGWIDSYPATGVSTNYMDDPDGDGMNNLFEYALGGVPVTADASSVQPFFVMESGAMYYVYKQRKNYEDVGLNYQVLSGTDLVLGPLTNATTLIGAGEYDSDFNLVTNGISTDAPNAFMQLTIEKND